MIVQLHIGLEIDLFAKLEHFKCIGLKNTRHDVSFLLRCACARARTQTHTHIYIEVNNSVDFPA